MILKTCTTNGLQEQCRWEQIRCATLQWMDAQLRKERGWMKQAMVALQKLHHDTQHNGTQHNYTQLNGTQHNGIQHNDTQHYGTQHNDTQFSAQPYFRALFIDPNELSVEEKNSLWTREGYMYSGPFIKTFNKINLYCVKGVFNPQTLTAQYTIYRCISMVYSVNQETGCIQSSLASLSMRIVAHLWSCLVRYSTHQQMSAF